MGGATALRVGHSDQRAKCILPLDPWMAVLHKEIWDDSFNGFTADQAIQMITTKSFLGTSSTYGTMLMQEVPPSQKLDFDPTKTLNHFIEKLCACSKKINIITEHTCHAHQMDYACIMNFELEMPRLAEKYMPASNGTQLYQMNIWLMLQFLHSLKYNDQIIDITLIKQNLLGMEKYQECTVNTLKELNQIQKKMY